MDKSSVRIITDLLVILIYIYVYLCKKEYINIRAPVSSELLAERDGAVEKGKNGKIGNKESCTNQSVH